MGRPAHFKEVTGRASPGEAFVSVARAVRAWASVGLQSRLCHLLW